MLLLFVSATTCGLLIALTLAIVASGMDGPGMGLTRNGAWDALLVDAVFPVAYVARLAWRRVADPVILPIVVATAAAASGTFLILQGPQIMFAAAWTYRCGNGEHRACSPAGDLFAYGIGVRTDRRRAAALYRAGCRGGELTACLKLLNKHRHDAEACGKLEQLCTDATADQWHRDSACEQHERRCAATD